MNDNNKGILLLLTKDICKELNCLDKFDEVNTIINSRLNNYELTKINDDNQENDIEEKLEMYFQCLRLENKSELTIRNRRYDLMKLKELNKPVNKITSYDLKSFLLKISKDTKSNTTNTKLGEIKSFFKWLYEEDLIEKDVSSNIKRVKERKSLREPLTIENVEKLRMSCITYREKLLIELLLSTGLRLSECVNIKMEDIDFNNKTIKVIGKGNKERIVLFNPKTYLLINKYINEERKGEDEHMFHSLKSPYNKLAPRTIEKIVCDIGKRANINQKLTPHILRHTFASLTLQRGAKLQTIQKLLGHESITTTQIYAKDSVDNIIHDYNSNITF